MSVLVQTSYGDLTIDLFVDKSPTASKNFIKLCKMKHYNNSLFINVQKDHLTLIQSSKPTTVYREVFGDEDFGFFEDEVDMEMKINRAGLICTANQGPNMNNSQFFITLTDNNLTSLHAKHTVFGEVQDGHDTLKKINAIMLDPKGRPLLNVRILHTHVIDDPFEDLPGMKEDVESPPPQKDDQRLEVSEHLQLTGKNKTDQELIKATREQKAKKQAVTLQIIGQLPDANAKPPENVLFVCKLNPVTQQNDLELIFSRYGNVKRCEIVRDWKTGQSLQYAFVEYETPQSCEEAYLKMQKAMIDNRRIEVDFCQSVPKLMPKFGKKPEKKYGELRDSIRGQLVPKFRQGMEIYGQKSNKYGLVIGDGRQPKDEQARPRDNSPHKHRKHKRSQSPQQQPKARKGSRQKQRSRQKEKRHKEKSSKKHKRKHSRSRSSRSDRKHSKHHQGTR